MQLNLIDFNSLSTPPALFYAQKLGIPFVISSYLYLLFSYFLKFFVFCTFQSNTIKKKILFDTKVGR